MDVFMLMIIFLEVLQMSDIKAQEPTPLTTSTTTPSAISSSLVNASLEQECKYHKKKCPFDVDMNSEEGLDDSQLNRLFPGLFHNISSFQNIMLSFGGDVGILVNYSKVRSRRRHPKTVQREKRNGVCCQTKHQAIIPLTVAYNDREYNVKHGEDSYQIVYTGFCRNESDNISDSEPSCTTTYIYHWILIEDLELTYEPPVKFIPVMFQGYCSCLNIG